MAVITEQLVWTSDVSATGVAFQQNTIASDDVIGIATTSLDWTFELTNLSQSPASIISIQPKIEGRTNASGGTFAFFHKILNGSSTELYSEAFATSDDEDNSNSGATRTTSDGSTAWTENDINTLRIRWDFIANLGGATVGFVDHFYVEVKYNLSGDNAGKVLLNSGKILLNSGKIYMPQG